MSLRLRGATLLLILGMALIPLTAIPVEPRAIRGNIDLSGLGPGKMAKLDGEWAFYWRSFIEPASPPEPSVYGAFPGEWKRYAVTGIDPLGYGSYRLKVTGIDPSLDLGIGLSSFLSAARIFADGREIDSQGTPGRNARSERPEWSSRVLRIGPQRDGKLELVIHLSNWSDRSGGSQTSIVLGDFRAVEEARDRRRQSEVFIVGAFIAMGVYFLFLHAFRPADAASLHFGLLCLVLAVRVLSYEELLLLEVLAGLPWEWLFRIGYLSFSLALAFFAGTLRSLFPAQFDRRAFHAIAAVSAAYSLVVIVAPPLPTSRLLVYFQAFALLTGVFSLTVLFRAIRARERGALLLAIGALLLFVTATHDILVSNGLIPGRFLAQIGLAGLLFSMSVVIARKLASAFETAERLAGELDRKNAAMRRFVPAEFLKLLGRRSVEEVELGDHSAAEMTVLFADIASFTKLSEELGPEGTFAFINEYLARLGPIVRDHRGFVDKYLGDGIMALFPGTAEDAARCAIAMHRELERFNEDRRMVGAPAVAISIGIHSGPLMLGAIGENERMDGTVIADAVNLASRVEGIAKSYGIGIAASERVLLGLEDPSAYRLRFLGKIAVKGKREPISVFEMYDGDPESLRKAKDTTRGIFEKALKDFYEQSYAAASRGFGRVLAALPGDEASLHYLRIMRRIQAAGWTATKKQSE